MITHNDWSVGPFIVLHRPCGPSPVLSWRGVKLFLTPPVVNASPSQTPQHNTSSSCFYPFDPLWHTHAFTHQPACTLVTAHPRLQSGLINSLVSSGGGGAGRGGRLAGGPGCVSCRGGGGDTSSRPLASLWPSDPPLLTPEWPLATSSARLGSPNPISEAWTHLGADADTHTNTKSLVVVMSPRGDTDIRLRLHRFAFCW